MEIQMYKYLFQFLPRIKVNFIYINNYREHKNKQNQSLKFTRPISQVKCYIDFQIVYLHIMNKQ